MDPMSTIGVQEDQTFGASGSTYNSTPLRLVVWVDDYTSCNWSIHNDVVKSPEQDEAERQDLIRRLKQELYELRRDERIRNYQFTFKKRVIRQRVRVSSRRVNTCTSSLHRFYERRKL